MDSKEILSSMLPELRRGVMVLCVLGKLREPMYGYDLTDKFSAGGLKLESNTVYPLLRRLESQGLLESRWDTDGVKPRKYYNTTELGCEVYKSLKEHWISLTESVNNILED